MPGAYFLAGMTYFFKGIIPEHTKPLTADSTVSVL
jgi:hypothetical protein